MFKQELSTSQSSLFSHAMGIAGTIGGGGGRGGRGSGVGRGESATRGGSPVVVGPAMGLIGESGCTGSLPTSGGYGFGGSSKAIAEHLMVGFPVVPGGHLHNGRFP